MSLPFTPTAREKVTVAGEEVEIRGLTRAEVMKVTTLEGNTAAMEILIVALATDSSEAEIREWYALASSADVVPIIEAVKHLSALEGDLPKVSGPPS